MSMSHRRSILSACIAFGMANYAAAASEEHRRNLVYPSEIGHKLTLSGKFSWRGKYGAFIRTEPDDEWVYLRNLDPRNQQEPKLTERIKPGHLQQNGRHERMHLTLKKGSNQTCRS